MNVRTPLLLVVVLALALTWGLPAQAETAAVPLCLAEASPAADLLELGLVESCPEVGIPSTDIGSSPSCSPAAATASPTLSIDSQVCGKCGCLVPSCKIDRDCDAYCGGVPGFGDCVQKCCQCVG